MIVSTALRLPKGAHPTVGTASANTPTAPIGVLRSPERDLAPIALNSVRQRLWRLRGWQANWDGFGSPRPSRDSIDQAEALLPEFFHGAAQTELGWITPHLSANEDGDVVLEWWRDVLKVTVYVTNGSATFMRVWGTDPDTEMDEGQLVDPQNDFARIWAWLRS